MDLILVNEVDEPIGTMEKMEVHRKGVLHRAFSVFIFNKKGEMLGVAGGVELGYLLNGRQKQISEENGKQKIYCIFFLEILVI
jgi:hypothetical protein